MTDHPSPPREPESPDSDTGAARIETHRFVLRIPIPGASPFVAEIPRPMVESQWEFLMDVLASMKPGLVVS